MSSAKLRQLIRGAGVIAGLGATSYGLVTFYKVIEIRQINAESPNQSREKYPGYLKSLPSREEQLKALRETPEYDVVIVGGGCMGSGIALDSVTRGLKTALIESDDFASGTSSRSSKMIHGGARNLQKAITGLDWAEFKAMKEALTERANILNVAPHLCKSYPILVPVYKWWQMPYFFAGMKVHDILSGRQCVKSSYIIWKSHVTELFPLLKNKKLLGGVIYYDGQHNDARVNLSVALTAARLSATVVNHVKCIEVIKHSVNGKEQVCGAKLKDMLSGKEWVVRTKCLINATGHLADSVLKMDDPSVPQLCLGFEGVHIVLPSFYSPGEVGLVDPGAPKGQTVFLLPWEKATIARTTASPGKDPLHPSPNANDIEFILKSIGQYLNGDLSVKRNDVLSAWVGTAATVANSKKEHIVHVSDSNLISFVGGHWTTYRSLAKETLDTAIKACGLQPSEPTCQTLGLILEGGHKWTPNCYAQLIQEFGISTEVAQHLSETYGDRAFDFIRSLKTSGRKWPLVGKRLHEDYPFLEEEVAFAVREEYAMTPEDFLARRLRLAFVNSRASLDCLPKVVELMGKELKWTSAEKKGHFVRAADFINREMGAGLPLEAVSK